MRSITARDIQVFVAGAFVLAGLNGLVGSITLAASGHYGATPIITGLFLSALPFGLGIAILAGSIVALRMAQIWLWMAVAFGVVVYLPFALIAPAKARLQGSGLGIAVEAILLGLLSWSKSSRFTHPTSNQAMQRTAPRSDA